MATHNDVTGDPIRTKSNNQAWDEGWELLYGRKPAKLTETPQPTVKHGPTTKD